MDKRKCLNCEEEVLGRAGKKFCTDYCKSNYNYQKNKSKESSRFKIVDKTLKLNRKILRDFNRAGKSTVRKEKLLNEGFNPNYFTNYWKNKKGQVYLLVYDYGFLELKENGKSKYVLVTWQNYMEK